MDNASLWGVIILLPIWAALADQGKLSLLGDIIIKKRKFELMNDNTPSVKKMGCGLYIRE